MNEYFLQQHSTAIYTSILYELILEELINVIQVYFSESEYSTNGSSCSSGSGSSRIVHDITILLQQAKLKTGLNYDTIPHTTSTTNTHNTTTHSNNTTIILNKLTRRATIYRENTTTPLKTPTRNTEISISPRFLHG